MLNRRSSDNLYQPPQTTATTLFTEASTLTKSLRKFRPRRSFKDYRNNLWSVLITLFGLLYMAAVYVFTQFSIEKEKKHAIDTKTAERNALNNYYHILRKVTPASYTSRYGDRITPEPYMSTCYTIENMKQLEKCKETLENPACKEIQQVYCSLSNATELCVLAGKGVGMTEYMYPTMSAGALVAFYGIHCFLEIEKNRLRLYNLDLGEDAKQNIKSLGKKLKIDIADTANLDDILFHIEKRMDTLKGLKEYSLVGTLYNKVTSVLPGRRTAEFEIPYSVKVEKLTPIALR